MYSSFYNQSLHLLRYALAFFILFLACPRFIFTRDQEDFFDNAIANYVKMVLFLICLGYVLVMLKLFEFLSLLVIIMVVSLISKLKRQNQGWEEMATNILTWLYDFAEGRIKLFRMLVDWLKRTIEKVKDRTKLRFSSVAVAGCSVLFMVCLGYAAYLRFYDAVMNAAPAMSDAYVTLAWIKYISRRVLFNDGIYPQGFHIIMAVLQKIAAIDTLYILKYTGPLNGVLVTLSLYHLVARLSGRAVPGILSAFIYGVIGKYLPHDWFRQASTNSQEFGFVFIMPALYFFYRYFKCSRREDLWTGAAALFAAGLVHSFAFAFIGLGMGMLMLTSFFTEFRKSWKKSWNTCLAGLAGVAVSLVPAGIGLLMGRSFHGSSAEYLIAQDVPVTIPLLGLLDYGALFSLVLLFIYSLFSRKRGKELLAERFIAFLGAGAFVVYYWGGIFTKSIAVATRSASLWALTAPVCIGMGWYALTQIIPVFYEKKLEILLAFCLFAVAVINLKPAPIIPYKMEYNSAVEQYLRISKSYRPTEWMIVSQEEGYAMALGKGYHLMVSDFVAWYDPETTKLYRLVDGVPVFLYTVDIFIYQEKKLFRTGLESLAEIEERRAKDKVALEDWLRKYRATHDNISIFYEDDDLCIWHIHQPPTREETLESIWEKGGGKK